MPRLVETMIAPIIRLISSASSIREFKSFIETTFAGTSKRNRRCVSLASFSAMLILLTKSALLWAACASSTFAGTSKRNRRCVSLASFSAMLILLMKSALLWAACASSTFAGTLVPARRIWLIKILPTPGRSSSFTQSWMTATAKSKVLSTIFCGVLLSESPELDSNFFILNFEFLISFPSEGKEALRPGEHQHNQQQRINNHPRVADPAERTFGGEAGKVFDVGQHPQTFRQQRQQNCGDNDADGVAHAAE